MSTYYLVPDSPVGSGETEINEIIPEKLLLGSLEDGRATKGVQFFREALHAGEGRDEAIHVQHNLLRKILNFIVYMYIS